VINKTGKLQSNLAFLIHVINYIENNVNEKFKAQAEKFLLERRNGFRKADPASIHRLALNNFEKKHESLTF
jgi:hypothetical protein